MDNHYQVGIGKQDITPRADGYISGSLFPRKTSFIKDPLFAKAMVIHSGNVKVVIVSLDIVVLLAEEVTLVKREIESATGISQAHMILCPSHTHSGPYTTTWFELAPTSDEVMDDHAEIEQQRIQYMNKLRRAIVQSVIIAHEDLELCKLGIANTEVDGLGQNRRLLKENNDGWNSWLIPPEELSKYPAEGPIDPNLFVMAAVKADGRIKAVLYNYALHANNNPTAGSVSADYPGQVNRVVAEALGTDVMTFYLAGACGNINPSLTSDEIGIKIGQSLVNSLRELDFTMTSILSVESVEVDFPYRQIDSFQEAEILRKWPDGIEFFYNCYQFLKTQNPSSEKVNLTGIRFGEVTFITNPSELFVELGLELKRQSPFAHTVVITLTNGYIGYVPTLPAFAHGGYETFYSIVSFLTPQAGNEIVNHSLNLLKKLR